MLGTATVSCAYKYARINTLELKIYPVDRIVRFDPKFVMEFMYGRPAQLIELPVLFPMF
jgi:hypothetical protein